MSSSPRSVLIPPVHEALSSKQARLVDAATVLGIDLEKASSSAADDAADDAIKPIITITGDVVDPELQRKAAFEVADPLKDAEQQVESSVRQACASLVWRAARITVAPAQQQQATALPSLQCTIDDQRLLILPQVQRTTVKADAESLVASISAAREALSNEYMLETLEAIEKIATAVRSKQAELAAKAAREAEEQRRKQQEEEDRHAAEAIAASEAAAIAAAQQKAEDDKAGEWSTVPTSSGGGNGDTGTVNRTSAGAGPAQPTRPKSSAAGRPAPGANGGGSRGPRGRGSGRGGRPDNTGGKRQGGARNGPKVVAKLTPSAVLKSAVRSGTSWASIATSAAAPAASEARPDSSK